MPPEFLVDRSLGRYEVANAIRARGYVVRTLFEVYGPAEETLPDSMWLADAGGNGWPVLTANPHIKRVKHELEVVQAEAVQIFSLPRGNLTGREQVARFLTNLDAIVRTCQRPGPYIYSVLPDRIELRWP